MRALVVHPGPAFSVADVHDGWAKGLKQAGVQVAVFNLDDRLGFYTSVMLERDGRHLYAFSTEAAIQVAMKGLSGACYEWWPDVVVVVSAFFVDEPVLSLMRRRGQRVVIIHTESPYEDDRQIDIAAYADLNVVNDPTNLDRFMAAAPTVYLPHCYDPDIHHPRSPDPALASDFCFVGTGYPSRIEFFEQVDWTGIHPAFAGNWQGLTDGSPLAPFLVNGHDECMPNRETAARYCSTVTSANLYRTEAQRDELAGGWAAGPREIELAACGTWFARTSRPESDGLFPMLPTFGSPGELGEQIRWALCHPDQRTQAAAQARAAVAERTFTRNAGELLALLDL